MAYFIARRGIRTAQQLQAFLVGVGFIALYFGLIGIAEILNIQWLIFPQFILDPKLGTHFGRPRGIFLNASAYGFLVWLYFTDRTPRRFLWPLVIALAMLPLVYTVQRAAWLSGFMALGGTALAWPHRRVILAGLLVFFAACGFLLASATLMKRLEAKLGDTDTLEFRLAHIERGWAMFQANPILGVGLNRYALEIENYSSWHSKLNHAHNTWITLVAELGMVGFLPYFAIFGFALFKSMKLYWRFPQYRAILGILVSITLAFLVMTISLDVRGHLYANALLFASWGMLVEAIRRESVLQQRQAIAYRRVVNFI
jgi:putative inorganic carbon (hco3(-)) transporter